MSFEHRKTRALEVLSKTGMTRSHYAPPLIRLLWKAGVQVPPPHFLPFLRTALGTGLWFGMFWGLIMWIFFWSRPDAAPPYRPWRHWWRPARQAACLASPWPASMPATGASTSCRHGPRWTSNGPQAVPLINSAADAR